ncbi:MAG: signal peptidase I [Bacteroidales bacterium]|nr:signal peptidase I [Bacteroidales bacterium]MDD2832320.1 signal peptidase I [Bacteroidales bacterium]MDD4474040.1 signal peptidase I [Bacteroidales bacterium]MDD5047236.1 signal peptidase I [Bacteroidales bacterium]MDD5517627.1 signal peptidase I [Bacteroidales bacterium]
MCALFCIFCLIKYDLYIVKDNSMLPTLKNNDVVITKKVSKSNIPRLTGKIIVFYFPYGRNKSIMELNVSNIYIKRCVGDPGDTISISNGYISNSKRSDTINIFTQEIDYSLVDINSLSPRSYDVITNNHNYKCDNIFNMKQIYIPRKGETILLTEELYYLYKKIIDSEGSYDDLDSCYTFLNNYYFACGDNILKSIDSRHWGFIPESFIIGYK